MDASALEIKPRGIPLFKYFCEKTFSSNSTNSPLSLITLKVFILEGVLLVAEIKLDIPLGLNCTSKSFI